MGGQWLTGTHRLGGADQDALILIWLMVILAEGVATASGQVPGTLIRG